MMLFQRRKANRVECISACICPCDYLRASATYDNASIYVSLCVYIYIYTYLNIYATLALCISYIYSLMSISGVPSHPLSGALSDPLFGAPSEPPTVSSGVSGSAFARTWHHDIDKI